MSILAEILQSAEKVNTEEINKKVPELRRTVEALKSEVMTDIENIYVKYSKRWKQNQLILNKALQVEKDLSNLKERADFMANKQLVKTNFELSKNVEELQYIDFSLQVVLDLQNSSQLLHTINEELELKNYSKCVEILKELNRRIDAIAHDELGIIKELKLTVLEKENRLKNILKNIFTDNIDITMSRENITTLKVRKGNEDIKTALLALYSNTQEVYPLNCLTKSLWESILITIVDHDVSLNEHEDSSYVTLSLLIRNTEKNSTYREVFDNLKQVLAFLLKNFNYNISDELTTLEYIGNDIRDNLSELIIKNCLRDTIPSKAEELQNYKIVIEHTKELENALLDAKIFNKDTTSILEYASAVDVLFINKKCQEYLDLATTLMKKDLHEMVEVGVPYDTDYPLGHQLHDFPQCSVSKNVQELLKLCENILQESVNASPECSGRLFTTVTNILIKYSIFVPEFHKNFLTTLPQQVALFHNNCLYISHILLKWNIKYCSQLKHTLVLCDFTTESSRLQVAAIEMFSNYIEGQVKQINEIMSAAQLDGPTIETLEPKTEKCIRQCLRQQELLKTVWHKVLSYNVYNKSIGTIVDTLCKTIITSVVKFEDIPAKVAEQLVEVIKLVLIRAPKLFTNPKEITMFVPLWYKLNELNFVLNGSLIDINDRWADGKGPLALQFKGSELKHLIKALFQNTDRRALVLTKIQDIAVQN